MDHTFLADDHLALNETTFTWPDRIMPIIKMRYIYTFTTSFSKLFFFAILGLQPRDVAAIGGQYNKNYFYKLLEKCRKVDKLGTGDFNLKVTLFVEE